VTAIRPHREIVAGRFNRLEPYRPEHLPGLWAALGRPEVFAGGYGGGPAGLPKDEAAFHAWAPQYFPHTTGNTYVVVVQGGPHDGEVVGDVLRADGSWRDTAVFSVLVDEWPAVHAGLEARLEPWGDRPVLFRSV
jgi:hypothetical protein